MAIESETAEMQQHYVMLIYPLAQATAWPIAHHEINQDWLTEEPIALHQVMCNL